MNWFIGFYFRGFKWVLCDMTKQEGGYILYEQGVDLEDIATILKVKYNTVAAWSSKGKWKSRKSKKLIQESTSQDRIRNLIDYQLTLQEKIVTIQEINVENEEDVSELKKLMISRGDIDALVKLASAIKSKEITWDQVVQSSRELIEYISVQDLALSKKLSLLVSEWLNIKREQ